MKLQARVEPFLSLNFNANDLLFDDKEKKRFISPREIAFVASRITTSILNNSGVSDKISYDVFLEKWKADYVKFTDRKPSKFKMGCAVQVLVQYRIITKINRRKATPLYSLGELNPYKNKPNGPPPSPKHNILSSDPPSAQSLSLKTVVLEEDIQKDIAQLQSKLKGE